MNWSRVIQLARDWRAWKIEWLPVVDERGRVTGKASRRRCHSDTHLLHPVVHMHVTNLLGDICLQQRDKHKCLLPGKWDTAVGGHVCAGESIESALRRESREELGITSLSAYFLGHYTWETPDERELVFAFHCTGHDAIRANTREVETIRFWSREEIEDPANTALLTPNFLHEYALFLR